MLTFHSVHFHRQPFVASYQWIILRIKELIHDFKSLVRSFEKAVAASRAFAQDPSDQEAIRQIIFND